MTSPSNGKLLVFSALLSSEDAVFMLRINGPWRAAGWTVERGNVNSPQESEIRQSDAVLIHRDYPAYTDNYRQIIQHCSRAGTPLIYETDDLLIEPPADHIGYLFFEAGKQANIETIGQANAVVVSTEQLKTRLSAWNNNIHVVSNYLHDKVWKLNPPELSEPEVITVAYCGQTSHRHDIDPLVPVFKRLLNRYPERIRIKFYAIAPPEELRGLPGIEWMPLVVQSYSDYVQVISAQACDIFLAPLADTPFNRCKSAIKFLEHAALGRPAVYSNLAPYSGIVEHGETGLLATTDDDWEQALCALIEDAQLRHRMAAASQRFVASSCLLSNNGAVLTDSYSRVIHSARKALQGLYEAGSLGAPVK